MITICVFVARLMEFLHPLSSPDLLNACQRGAHSKPQRNLVKIPEKSYVAKAYLLFLFVNQMK